MSADVIPKNDLAIAPLGAGDLIDRAVRFYRRNFWTLAAIAAPPVVVGTAVSVAWTLAARSLFGVTSAPGGDFERLTYYLFVWIGSLLIWFTESALTLSVMGGASRSFVRHLLFGEPVTFRATYRNFLGRAAALIVASGLITLVLGTAGFIIFYLGFLIAAVAVLLVVAVFQSIPVIAVLLAILLGGAAAAGAVWLFFLVASRVVYVPQAMLVEGRGVLSAIGRSASLAGGSVRRLIALFLFTTVAAYSALAVLYVPLLWYASAVGVEVFSFDSDLVPAWYEVGSQVISQASLILLLPVWMIGLCLLYVDERVRREAYDIELLAARRFGDMPDVPVDYINPLQPALGSTPSAASPVPPGKSITTLGLDK